MSDGLYRVQYGKICAGFVIEDGEITQCAPILRNRMDFWQRVAKRVEDGKEQSRRPSVKTSTAKETPQ